jgi:hypothetical protein
MSFHDFAVAFISGMVGVLGMLTVNLFLADVILSYVGGSIFRLFLMIVSYGILFVMLVIFVWRLRGKPDGLESKGFEILSRVITKIFKVTQ